MSDRPAKGPRALVLALLALVASLAIVGCAQEGKLIQVPLPVHAVAADFHIFAHTDTAHTDTLNVRFKISVHVKNPCESEHVQLELHRQDPPPGSSDPVFYEIIPVARYNADDRCVQNGVGELDTVITLNVNGLILGELASKQILNSIAFRVVATGQTKDIDFSVDTLVTAPLPSAVGFQVKVEDASGVKVQSANVAVDRLDPGGAATALDSTLTDTDGFARFAFPVIANATTDTVFLPYRVRVTSGSSSRIVSDPTFWARLYRLEKIVVRI